MQYIYNRILKSSAKWKSFYPSPATAVALAALIFFVSTLAHAQMQATLQASSWNSMYYLKGFLGDNTIIDKIILN